MAAFVMVMIRMLMTKSYDMLTIHSCGLFENYQKWHFYEPEDSINTLGMGSFKLFKRPFLGFLTILTL